MLPKYVHNIYVFNLVILFKCCYTYMYCKGPFYWLVIIFVVAVELMEFKTLIFVLNHKIYERHKYNYFNSL